MIVQYDKSFEKSLKSINSQIILHRLKLIIIQIENTSQLAQIPNIIGLDLTGLSQASCQGKTCEVLPDCQFLE